MLKIHSASLELSQNMTVSIKICQYAIYDGCVIGMPQFKIETALHIFLLVVVDVFFFSEQRPNSDF